MDLTDGCSITAQGARITSDGTYQYIQQVGVMVVGDTYEMEYEITESVSGYISVTNSFGADIVLRNTLGFHKFYAVASNTFITIKRNNTPTDVTIDNIKIKRLNGDDTPRIDYTDGGCPVLLTEPQSTNLITQSNDFSFFDLELKLTATVVEGFTDPMEVSNAISPDGHRMLITSEKLVQYVSPVTNAKWIYTYLLYLLKYAGLENGKVHRCTVTLSNAFQHKFL